MKKKISRYLPTPESLKKHKGLKFLGTLLNDPNIWYINRRSISGGVAIGFFFAWNPIPIQFLCAAIAAVIFRKNLPVATVATLITNPLTMVPLFYFAYKLGVLLLGQRLVAAQNSFELTFEWFFSQSASFWQPFLLGCFILGCICSLVGYIGTRLLWRVFVVRRMQRRQRNPEAKDQD